MTIIRGINDECRTTEMKYILRTSNSDKMGLCKTKLRNRGSFEQKKVRDVKSGLSDSKDTFVMENVAILTKDA